MKEEEKKKEEKLNNDLPKEEEIVQEKNEVEDNAEEIESKYSDGESQVKIEPAIENGEQVSPRPSTSKDNVYENSPLTQDQGKSDKGEEEHFYSPIKEVIKDDPEVIEIKEIVELPEVEEKQRDVP